MSVKNGTKYKVTHLKGRAARTLIVVGTLGEPLEYVSARHRFGLGRRVRLVAVQQIIHRLRATNAVSVSEARASRLPEEETRTLGCAGKAARQ